VGTKLVKWMKKDNTKKIELFRWGSESAKMKFESTELIWGSLNSAKKVWIRRDSNHQPSSLESGSLTTRSRDRSHLASIPLTSFALRKIWISSVPFDPRCPSSNLTLVLTQWMFSKSLVWKFQVFLELSCVVTDGQTDRRTDGQTDRQTTQTHKVAFAT
jgi:hypothetical protein